MSMSSTNSVIKKANGNSRTRYSTLQHAIDFAPSKSFQIIQKRINLLLMLLLERSSIPWALDLIYLITRKRARRAQALGSSAYVSLELESKCSYENMYAP